jgi:chemotaxis protein histidine kinase CheA
MGHDNQSYLEEIKKLAELKEVGAITEEEFHSEKAKLLKENTSEEETTNKQTQTPKQKKSFKFPAILLWILSLFGIMISLGAFLTYFWSGVLVLLSALIILPPIRKLYLKKISIRLRYVLIISFILFLTGVLISPAQGYTSSGTKILETQRIVPKELEYISDNPQLRIAYNCVNVTSIKINNRELTQEGIEKICTQAFVIKLKDGENKFLINIVSSKGEIAEIVKVYFDEKKYQQELAAKVEAEAQAKAEADAKAAAEDEAKTKAQAEAQAKALTEWKAKYLDIKKNTIEVSFAKSTEMNEVLSNGTDAYTSRNNAIQYKNYFLQTCNKNLEEALSPIPQILKGDVEKVNDFYYDFCMYNEFVARNVVNYLEETSVSKQYDYLDRITYNMQLVADSKFSMQVHMIVIEETIK